MSMAETCWTCAATKICELRVLIREAEFGRIGPPLNCHFWVWYLRAGHEMGKMITYPAWLCQNSYWKWWFIVDFPIKHGDFPYSYVSLPDGNS